LAASDSYNDEKNEFDNESFNFEEENFEKTSKNSPPKTQSLFSLKASNVRKAAISLTIN
jgi:hypothetical protein